MKTFRATLALIAAFFGAMVALAPVSFADTASISIPVTVTLDGTSPASHEAFTVCIEGDTGDEPLPATPWVLVPAGSTAEFEPMAYDRSGFYWYNVYQQERQEPSLTQDLTLYKLQVVVNEGVDGSLSAVASVYHDDLQSKSASLSFANECQASHAVDNGGHVSGADQGDADPEPGNHDESKEDAPVVVPDQTAAGDEKPDAAPADTVPPTIVRKSAEDDARVQSVSVASPALAAGSVGGNATTPTSVQAESSAAVAADPVRWASALTGDANSMGMLIIVACLAGCVAVILAVFGRRNHD